MNEKKVISTYSNNTIRYINSGKYICNLNEKITKLRYISIVGGRLPYTSEPFLYLDIDEITTKPINNGRRTYTFILRYEPAASATDPIIITRSLMKAYKVYPPNNDIRNNIQGNYIKHPYSKMLLKKSPLRLIGDYIGNLNRKISLTFYDKNNNQYDFSNGLSKFTVVSFTNTSPTVITTSINHGLTVGGDYITINGFTNGSTDALNNTINTTTYQITSITAVNKFSVAAINLSAEAATQQDTNIVAAYAFGYGSYAENRTNQRVTITLISQNGTKTQITTSSNHNFHPNEEIFIHNVKNYATVTDGQRLNKKHKVDSIIDNTNFLINIPLSAYTTPAQDYGVSPAYLLGKGATIFLQKYVTSLDFEIHYLI
jgi:hypothetical protein